jgi:hypothetical protein
MGASTRMGVKRSFRRRKQREVHDLLRHKLIPRQAAVKITCGKCGREVTVVAPAVPKLGVQITGRTQCPCGNPIAVTLTGRGRATSTDPP